MRRCKYERMGLEPGELHVRGEKTGMRSVSKLCWAEHGGWWYRKVAGRKVS